MQQRTAFANTKSTDRSGIAPKFAAEVVCASIMFSNPRASDFDLSILIDFGSESAAYTFPVDPTSSAIGIEKYPGPQPTSATTVPAERNFDTFFFGGENQRRTKLSITNVGRCLSFVLQHAACIIDSSPSSCCAI